MVFASGEPSGLCTTLPGVLGQLRHAVGPDTQILVGFDRGGSFPVAFTACRQAGMGWLTYRRGRLAATDAPVRHSWCLRDGKRHTVTLIDETIDIAGYGPARQLTLIEAGAPVLQVLTSDTEATGKPRGRPGPGSPHSSSWPAGSASTSQASSTPSSNRLSNGLVESTNTKIRVLTRIAYGFTNTDHLIALALLARGGHCPPSPRQ